VAGDPLALPHADWLALLLEREAIHRQDKRLGARLRHARLRHHAVPEDIDYRAHRGIDRGLLANLVKGDWIDNHDNLVITGPTGVGKSWLACALGHKACRDNRAVLYVRVPKLFDELALAHGDGSIGRRLKTLGAAQLLILDDWGLEPLGAQARHDLLEILEDRYGRRSTIVTSQLPIPDWHAVIGEATYADAILDRLVHNAHRLELSGESLRRSAPPSQARPQPQTSPYINPPTKTPRMGGIISEWWARSSPNRWAASSESASYYNIAGWAGGSGATSRCLRSASSSEPASASGGRRRWTAKRTGPAPAAWRRDTAPSRPSTAPSDSRPAAENEQAARERIGLQDVRDFSRQAVEALPHVDRLARQINPRSRRHLDHGAAFTKANT
jgi:DNA replication protein DnaC